MNNEENIDVNGKDPDRPWLSTWTNETFKPVDFTITVASVSSTVGKLIELPIYIQNFGLLTDNYTVDVAALNPNVVSIVNGHGVVGPLKGNYYYGNNETDVMRATLRVLYATSSTIRITVASEVSGISTTIDIPIQSELASLPEFDVYGFLQILAIATVALYVLPR